MQKSRINPAITQQLLESAPNAGVKGQAQYFTPREWAAVLALPLPKYRPMIVDFTAGNGDLLTGAAQHSRLLACDIDRFHPLLAEVGFTADLFVLNPPWALHWHRDRLTRLAGCPCRAVAEALAAHDGRTGRDTIDSTVATLCLALAYSSQYGEGLLIANEATLQRLIFAPGAPHRALLNHLWAHLVIDGNICQRSGDARVPEGAGDAPVASFKTGVLWFARSPQAGAPVHRTAASLAEATAVCTGLKRDRLKLRRGPEAASYGHTGDTREAWQAAAEEWERRTGRRPSPQWNIMLDTQGHLVTDLSLFDQHSTTRIPKDETRRLFALNGKSPMSLVIQKAHRKELERATLEGSIWRVAPAVKEAVRMAIKEYDAVRAPLRALNPIQRLGYLDEQDEIACCRDLLPHFVAGRRYPIRTLTISVLRQGTKMNLSGLLDEVEWTGSELCIYLKDGTGAERTFMEARLRGDDVHLCLDPQDDREENTVKIDYTLQQLVEHFLIPEVPDVATVHPELYQRNLALLHQIEQLVA